MDDIKEAQIKRELKEIMNSIDTIMEKIQSLDAEGKKPPEEKEPEDSGK